MDNNLPEDEATARSEFEAIAHQLQGQVDRLEGRNQALELRVARLERDRAVLRQRLADEVAGDRFQRMLRGLRKPPPTPDRGPDAQSDAGEGDPGILVPDGVGRILDLDLPRVEPRCPDLRIAGILDAFSEASFAPECQLVPITAAGWRDQLENTPPDLLLVESAFAGPSGSWAHRIARVGSPHPDLRAVVAWCRERAIPTVFWNKEDPANFRWFIASAALFDWVFTVDVNTIDRYKQSLGHDRVGVLPFAAQPALQFPGAAHRPGQVAFAGTYYAQKHPMRLEQIEAIVDPAREFGLHIFDRMGARQDPRFSWPERFHPHIIGRLSYPQVLEAYRRYRVFLNVNTVTASPTMCARRIFELAASGTPIVTGPSEAIEVMMPQGSISICRTYEQTRETLSALLGDEAMLQEQAARARRWVLAEHTYEQRLAVMLETIGLEP